MISSKLFGAEGRGEISLFLTNIAFIQLFCDFGNSSANINLSYKYDNLNIWKTSLIWILMVCVISIIPMYLFKVNHYIYITLSAFLLSINNNNLLILMGNREVNKRNMSLILIALLLVISIIVMFNLNYTIDSFFKFYVLTIVIGILFSSYWVKHYLKSKEQFKLNIEVFKKGFLAQLGHFVQFLNYRLFFYWVLYYLGKFELGIFNILIVLSESLWIVGHSIGQILHMKILNTAENRTKLKLTKRAIVQSLGATTLLFIVLLIIPNTWWVNIFNKDFDNVSNLLPYLSLGIIMFSVSNIITHYLHAMNEFKKIIMINVTGLVAGTLTCLLLISKMQLIGVCIAWSISFLFSFFVSVYYYIRKIKSLET